MVIFQFAFSVSLPGRVSQQIAIHIGFPMAFPMAFRGDMLLSVGTEHFAAWKGVPSGKLT